MPPAKFGRRCSYRSGHNKTIRGKGSTHTDSYATVLLSGFYDYFLILHFPKKGFSSAFAHGGSCSQLNPAFLVLAQVCLRYLVLAQYQPAVSGPVLQRIQRNPGPMLAGEAWLRALQDGKSSELYHTISYAFIPISRFSFSI
jgi:hypothetical protein